MSRQPLDRAASVVQARLAGMTEGLQSGDDSDLRTIWDEYCVQIQKERFIVFSLYEQLVYQFSLEVASELTPEGQEIIWLASRDGLDWEPSEAGETPPVLAEEVAEEICKQVWGIACDFTNPAIEAYLDRYSTRQEDS